MSHISPCGHRARVYRQIEQAATSARPAPTLRIAAGGSIVKLRAAGQHSPHAVAPRRGRITGFSSAARKRLIETLASINRDRVRWLPLMVTLTYPADYPGDGAIVKRHLDTWLKRLRREYPTASAVWKLEFQQRGAPHYHLLLFGVAAIDYKWVARSWFETVASGDTRHLAAGTRTEKVKSWRGVMSYAAKYLGKWVGSAPIDCPGRFWGVFNREALPIDWVEQLLTFAAFNRAVRLYRRFKASSTLAGQGWGPRNVGRGYTLFRDGDALATWARAIGS